MTDEHEAEVSRLLAAARHDEPAPPDVVARIDAALATEAAEAATGAPVVDLGARRGRQRRRTGLLAAAVVVVAGVGLGAVVLGQGGDVGDSGGSADSADSGDSEAGSTGEDVPAPEARDQDEDAPGLLGARAPLPRVRTGPTLAEDVVRALRTGAVLPAARARCSPADAVGPDDEVVRVLADGGRAELLAAPADDGGRAVTLHPCGDADDPPATLVVPAP